MPKVEIHLELSVPSEKLGVNQVIELLKQVEEELGTAMAKCYLEQVQDQVLEQVLGARWSKETQRPAPWSCPECGAIQGFSRRGSYPRVLRRTSLGRISFDLRQVTCRHCDHTFSPFPDMLDLEPYQASTTELRAKAVKVACQTSYARAAQHMHNLARVSVSATAIHQWAQTHGGSVTFDVSQGDGCPLLLDSTMVCAGDEARGAALNLGLSIQKRCSQGARACLQVYPVCFGVGETWSITGKDLKQVDPDRVVFDGGSRVTRCLDSILPGIPKQRGIWHLVRQLYMPLWRDGLRKEQAKDWMRQLGKLLYHPEHDVQETKAQLKDLIRRLSKEGLSHAATYLAAAVPHVFTYRERPDGILDEDSTTGSCAIRSTSPVERQMREINRRTDVGARWSVSGVENLIALDLIRRFDPEQWQTVWDLPDQSDPAYSAVELRIEARAEPILNVKTT